MNKEEAIEQLQRLSLDWEENEELLKFKNVWENFKKMLNEVKRQSEEREDRAFIYYDELIEGNEKLEKKHGIEVE